MTVASPDGKLSRPWTDEIIYMVLVDRFHRGGSGPAPVSPWHGGNLAGIAEKLDYIQDLGFTALWISPVYQNQPDGYHGYWPVDFFAVDSRFGTLEELRNLVRECHRRGLRVLLDTVLNHAGYDHPMARDPKYRNWFHPGAATALSEKSAMLTQAGMENTPLHGLPDFAHEHPEVARYLIDMALWWLDQTGVDGFRLDAVKHVPATFWKRFSAAVHGRAGADFLLLGEVFRGVPEYIARYQREDAIDSVFDVPFADTVRSALSRDSEAPSVGLWRRLWQLKDQYRTMLFNEILRKLFARRPADMRWFSAIARAEAAYTRPHMLATFIDNHDLDRFAHEADPPEERLRMALGLLLTWRGIPVVTYGTEIGMRGGTEGDNRAPMAFDANPELRAFLRKLIALRRAHPALTRGSQLELHADREVYAFLRDAGGSRIMVVMNNSRQSQQRTVTIPAWAGWSGSWRDALTGSLHEAREGKLAFTLGPRSTTILALDETPGDGGRGPHA